jgi:hypothetical protein
MNKQFGLLSPVGTGYVSIVTCRRSSKFEEDFGTVSRYFQLSVVMSVRYMDMYMYSTYIHTEHIRADTAQIFRYCDGVNVSGRTTISQTIL